MRVLPPLMMWLMSPTGSWKGKSTEASIWAANIHLELESAGRKAFHVGWGFVGRGNLPASHASQKSKSTRCLGSRDVSSGPRIPKSGVFPVRMRVLTFCRLVPKLLCPSARCQDEAASNVRFPKSPRKITTKTMFVRNAQIK